MKKIYLASPLGFSEAGRFFMNQKLIPLLKESGFEILDPWSLTDSSLTEKVLSMPYGKEKKEAWQKLNKIIGENNTEAIEESDIVFAVLDGVDVDSGTASEIGFAFGKEKLILGYRGDFRLSADNEGSIVNLQVQYFIEKSGGKIFFDLEQIKREISKYSN